MSRSFWLVCVVLSLACPVRAAELHWEAPEACPDVHALESESEQVLGEPLAKYPLRVVGVVTPHEDLLTLSLRITFPANAETRERELQAGSCQELLEAAASAIALAAAESGERGNEVPQSRDIEPQPRAASVDSEPEAVSAIALSVSGSSVWSTFPSMGLGGELQAAWMLRWLRIGIGVSWFPLREMSLTNDVRASFGMYFAELLVCGQLEAARARLFGCATADIGRMDAHLDAPELGPTESTAWRALGVRVGASYPIAPPLELTASLAAAMPLTRLSYYSQPTGMAELHKPAVIATRLLIGILFSL